MKNLKIVINSIYENDLYETVRAFGGHINYTDENGADTIIFTEKTYPDKVCVKIVLNGKEIFNESAAVPSEKLLNKKYAKRFSKTALYRALRDYSDTALPYGSLTGVRPTKLYYELLNEGKDAKSVFIDEFDVAPEKAANIETIIQNQKGLYNTDEKAVDVYVNIPFCPTRCAYCSFVAVTMKQLQKYVEPYINCVINEISIIKNVVLENSFKVRAVYFGGGTPTSLSVEQLRRIVEKCDFGQKEFTVEAGRPDTITADMLEMLSDCGVNRISVNPQTFKDETLKLIGRAHCVDDVLRAFELSEKYPFKVNMDLIAALPGESFDDFKRSVDAAVGLSPDNITVHTLSLKRGSVLTLNNYDNRGKASDMVDYSAAALKKAGYEPYYMYRQKYSSDNLENCGYAKSGCQCLYNIDIMEENTSITAIGAGAISKKVDIRKNRVERLANIKDVKGYIENFGAIAEKVKNFW